MTDLSIDELLNGKPGTQETPQDLTARKVLHGVSISWLMQVFRKDRQTVKRKLAPLTPIRMEKGNSPLYDLRQAADYLATPRLALPEILKNLRPEDLPNGLQKDYWDALIKKQKYELQAGRLWRDEAVLETLGEVFKHIKMSMQLLVSEIETKRGLTKEQRELLVELIDAMQVDLHARLVEMPKQKSTLSVLAELEDEKAEDEDVSDS